MEPTPAKPLEWWEEQQLNLLESLGFAEEVARFRADPEAWRALRAKAAAVIHEERGKGKP